MKPSPALRNAISPALRERVKRPSYLSKLAKASDLAPLFKVRLLFYFHSTDLFLIFLVCSMMTTYDLNSRLV